MSLFSDQESERISGAISAAERNSSGEIVAVVTEASESYHYVPVLWAALAALIVPWPLIHFTWMAVQWIYLIQLLVFLALVVILWPRRFRTALVPRSVQRAHAHRRATEQFLVQNLHTTVGRTGVLLFVSVAEHYATILADKSINALVPHGTWQDIVDSLTREIALGHAADGFVQAIERIGHHLAQHFPPGVADPNELPNHLIMLDG
jgi:putative membrane protein